MAALEIIVNVRDGQTMSQYDTPKSGKIKFINADTSATLLVTQKGQAGWPFCDKDYTTPKAQPISVPPNDAKAAWVCDSFAGGEVLYTTQIGTAAPEDPIIIFEKTKMQVSAPVAFFVGAAVGAILVAAILKMRRPQRPTQA